MTNNGRFDIRVYHRSGFEKPVVEARVHGTVAHVDSFDPFAAFQRRKFLEELAGRAPSCGTPAEVVAHGDPLIVEANNRAALEAMGGLQTTRPQPVGIGKMIADYRCLRESVIHGIARRGETVNIIAPPKMGKSWLAYYLALCVATGREWLGFACRQGRVLYIDAELHQETTTHRFVEVAKALDLPLVEYESHLEVLSLRGCQSDLHQIARDLEGVDAGQYTLIVLDAWYRCLPLGVNESDNAAIMALYNLIDSITGRLECAWVNVHHASKGSQAEKAITDVGSGAGSQSRAADTHLILRPHEEAGCVVLEGVVRSFAPVPAIPLRWCFPLWLPDGGIDPEKLKGRKATGDERQTERDQEGMECVLGAITEGKTVSHRKVRADTGYGVDRINRLVAMLKREGKILEKAGKQKGKRVRLFSKVVV